MVDVKGCGEAGCECPVAVSEENREAVPEYYKVELAVSVEASYPKGSLRAGWVRYRQCREGR